jgi:hypothetical protein
MSNVRVIVPGYKLLRLRCDGSLGPLFINRRQRIPVGRWLRAEEHPTKGFALRPGWHGTAKKNAPHLSTKGRVWCRCEFYQWAPHVRPRRQGGTWLIAQWMRVTKVLG